MANKSLVKVAKDMFSPEGKEPYYLENGVIRNLEELKKHHSS